MCQFLAPEIDIMGERYCFQYSTTKLYTLFEGFCIWNILARQHRTFKILKIRVTNYYGMWVGTNILKFWCCQAKILQQTICALSYNYCGEASLAFFFIFANFGLKAWVVSFWTKLIKIILHVQATKITLIPISHFYQTCHNISREGLASKI